MSTGPSGEPRYATIRVLAERAAPRRARKAIRERMSDVMTLVVLEDCSW